MLDSISIALPFRYDLSTACYNTRVLSFFRVALSQFFGQLKGSMKCTCIGAKMQAIDIYRYNIKTNPYLDLVES